MCYVCHRPGGLRGLLGWERRGGSLGDAGLEMTQSERRAPVPRNHSSHLQGERRKDKDASPHRGANTHKLTMGNACLPSLSLSHAHTHKHTQTDTHQNIIFYVWFLNMALKRIMLGTIMVAGHSGAHDPFKGPQHVCVLIQCTDMQEKDVSALAFKGSVHPNYKKKKTYTDNVMECNYVHLLY